MQKASSQQNGFAKITKRRNIKKKKNWHIEAIFLVFGYLKACAMFAVSFKLFECDCRQLIRLVS